ncbi:MAG: FGGY-family carbohydrate kinase, partial [Hungatella sp.]
MSNILVIDTGTSSMRGLLFQNKGEILKIFQIPYFMQVDGDKALQSATEFSKSLIMICRNMAAFCQEEQIKIAGLSFTSQRSSVIPVGMDGVPQMEAMMWYDKRSQSICSRINAEAEELVYRTCGMKANPVFSAPKIAWIKKYMPEVYKKTYKMMGIHDYLIYLCTGNFITDSSLASRTCLLDVAESCWSEELIALFGIDREKLCDIIPVGDIAGYVTKEFADITGMPEGIPVISAGGDQQCSALGQMLVDTNQVGITSGTASYVVAISDKPVFDPKRRINTNISARPDQWILEASNMSSGAVYHWMKKTFYGEETDYETVNQDVLRSEPLAQGLIMLPDLAGKGCPQWDSYARGSFLNVGFQHERKEFARAVIEGITAEITECYEVLKECLGDFSKVTSTGGLSKMPAFNQILADMMNIPVHKCVIEETTGIGAWANAAVAMGQYSSVGEVFKTLQEGVEQSISIPNVHRYESY